MTDTELQALFAKIVAMEYLMQSLFASEFLRADDPVNAATAFADDIRQRTEEIPLPGISEGNQMLVSETISRFLDQVTLVVKAQTQ